ncbi:hypothetical protein F66182_826 [Fusarium sp. NRRL 66182]|nr:hypothetical protein F66182_826 [Fusarium sp. NRRL 66182]
MHFAAVLTAATALAMGASADANADASPEPHSKPGPYESVISARIWGSRDCGGHGNALNYGELTLRGIDNNECHKFEHKIKSVHQYSHADHCKLVLYHDDRCKHGKHIKDGQCRETLRRFRSYRVECK